MTGREAESRYGPEGGQQTAVGFGHNPFVIARTFLVGLVGLAVVAGCAKEQMLDPDQLVLVTRSGCPTTDAMREQLDQALGALGVPAKYQSIDLATLAQNDARVGYPTPTLLYRDADIFGMPKPTPPFPDPT